MKNKLLAAVILSATGLASIATAATYTYTFNDMTWVPNNAKNTFTAMAWKTVSGEAHPASVGRVQITD